MEKKTGGMQRRTFLMTEAASTGAAAPGKSLPGGAVTDVFAGRVMKGAHYEYNP